MNNYFKSVYVIECHLFRGITVLFILTLTYINQVYAQDVEEVLKQKIIKLNGGISANSTFYYANGIDNRRDPFYWMLSANLNFNILGIIQAPFSVTLSQQNKGFSQPKPFNRFGISPKYKSVTAHLGHRTMNFSEYTLAGNMFFGAGVEVIPEGSFVRVSAMFGRLAKPVEKSAREGFVFATPTFRRLGYGVKVGLGRKKHLMDLILFSARDDENSIAITEEVIVTPESNLVLAAHSKHQFSNKIVMEFEYAYSLLTRDKRSKKVESEDYSFINNLGGLFKPNISSEFSTALTSSLNYNGEWYQVNIKYRKVDPGYRTLGSSFLNNGMKDITGGISWNLLDQKMNVATNFGMQQSEKENQVRRVIYGLNVNYNISERISVNTNYSNFATTTRQVMLQKDLLVDSLEYFQVSRNGSLNINWKLGNDSSNKTLFLSGSFQDATDSNDNSSTFFSLNIGQQMKISTHWQFSVSASFNRNKSELFNNLSTGPVLSLNRSFLEGKVRSSLSAALLRSYLKGELQSDVKNIRLTNSLRIVKKHSVSINLYYLNNHFRAGEVKKYSEYRGMINYNYSL